MLINIRPSIIKSDDGDPVGVILFRAPSPSSLRAIEVRLLAGMDLENLGRISLRIAAEIDALRNEMDDAALR